MLRRVSFILIVGVCATASPVYAQYPYPPYGWPIDTMTRARRGFRSRPNRPKSTLTDITSGRLTTSTGHCNGCTSRRGARVDLLSRGLSHHPRESVVHARRNAQIDVCAAAARARRGAGAASQARRTCPPRDGPTQDVWLPSRLDDVFGSLELRVRPVDATVLIDGEEWTLPEGQDRIFVDLSEGPHRVEVRKEGFVTYVRTVDVRRGRTVTLNVSLTAGRDGHARTRIDRWERRRYGC